MTVDEMIRRKNELGYSYEKISQLSGVPVGTVQKVLGKITKAPRYDTLIALEKIFMEDSYVREKSFTYNYEGKAIKYLAHLNKKQGEYTIEDRNSIPDDCRTELIDGVIYDLSSPNVIHQKICTTITSEIYLYIRDNKGDCDVFSAPLDVSFPNDNKTVVEPDILVVCDIDKLKTGWVVGAPDFVVEILSKSTWKRDCVIKCAKYAQMGVREYWIIDPNKQVITVYDFEGDTPPTIYGFDAVVPVRIYGGNCKIDFTTIKEAIDRYKQ